MSRFLCALLLAVAVVCTSGCSLLAKIPAGLGLGFEVERDGKTVGAECHKNPDGTWSCNVKAHLDSGDHSLPPAEDK